MAQVVCSSFSWIPNDVEDNPQLKHLKDGRNKAYGWWRQLEATQRGIKLVRKDGTPVSHLTAEENLVFVELVHEIKHLQLMYPI